MIISMIAAVGENRVIGRDNDLVWDLPDDMRFFVQKTKGRHVIMGRKNYQSIPEKFRPLPDRPNVVITRRPSFVAEGCVVINSLEEALQLAKQNGEEEAFIIGGGEIYTLGLAVAHRMYITQVKASFEGDAFFPEYNQDDWVETGRVHHPVDERHAYAFDFVTFEKKQAQ